MNWPTVTVLGSRVHIVSLADAVKTVESWIEEPRDACRQVIVTGYHGIWEAYKDPRLRHLLNAGDLWVPDGFAPVFVAHRRGYPHAVRIPGADLMRSLFERANDKGFSSFFYGDTDDTLAALREVLERDYPKHRIAGMLSPPFRELTPEEDEEIVDTINASEPDVVWVALGMPRQDIWAYEHKGRLNARVVIGVGAAFAFVAGTVKRAPQWMGNNGLEWLYRLIQEPRKCYRRSLIEGPRFWFHVALELTGLRRYPLEDGSDAGTGSNGQ